METVLYRKNSSSHEKRDSPFFNSVFHPKLNINQPNDAYEQVADAVAEKVMRIQANDSSFFAPSTYSVARIQRKCKECEEEKKLHRKETDNNEVFVNRSTENYIDSLNGKGKSLSRDERNFFESKMGYDFSGVQIHTNQEANQSAQSINALAYTYNNNIVFAPNQYQPDTESGKRLLAHELAHVIQQKKTNIILRQHSEGGPYHPPEGTDLRCGPEDTCSSLSTKINYLRHTIRMHQNWDAQNPNSDYPLGRHHDEIQQLLNALRRCINETIRCRNQPVFTPAPQENESTQTDSSSHQQSQEIPTWAYWLGGAAGVAAIAACFASGVCEAAGIIAAFGVFAEEAFALLMSAGVAVQYAR